MTTDWINDFRTKGYAKFSEIDLANMVDIDKVVFHYHEERLRDNFKDNLPVEVVKQMELVKVYLTQKYIDAAFKNYEFMNYVVAEGVDADSSIWHNDGFEGGSVFFLFYFDDQHEETAGEVEFRWPNGGHAKYYPKKGDLILLNQTPGFFHRASKSKIPRRLSSFTYNVEHSELLPK
jgi:hypothetical protein